MAWHSKSTTWQACLSLAVFGAMLPFLAAAQEQVKELVDFPINGEWDAVYFDKELGAVKGRATVDEARRFARVVYIHPKTGKKFILLSRRFSRTGEKITIELEGMQPRSAHRDGQNYPQKHLIVPESGRKIVVRVGGNTAEKELLSRKDSDKDRVELKLTIRNQSTLSGTWRYRADPVTRRDRMGYGRAGDFELQDDGSGLVYGSETWSRPKPVVKGAFALQSQTSTTRYGPHYPHPYQNDKFQGKKTSRTILIFGTDLPDGRNNRAVIKSESKGVAYGRVIYPDGTFQFSGGFLKPIETGKAKLLKRLERELKYELKKMGSPTGAAQAKSIAQESVEAFDYLVVEATLSDGIRPGLQTFAVNGSQNTWTLMFGNNRADIRFVREIDPKAILSRKTDTFGYTIQNVDQSITKGSLTIAISDDAPSGNGKDAAVKQGQTINGSIYETNTYTQLPDTIERFRRSGFFPRWNPKNVEGSPIVTNPGTYVGRYGTLVLNKNGSFTYQATVYDERFEGTGDAFIPETLRVEVRTNLDLDIDAIHVTIGRNGDLQKIGPKMLVTAHRQDGDRRLYRTGSISLVSPRKGGNKTSSTIDPSKDLTESQNYTLPVKHGDELIASIAELGTISFVPPPAVLKVHTTPARFPHGLSYLWKNHLKHAASCYPKLKELDWDRSNYDYVAEINKYVYFAWWKLMPVAWFLNPIGVLLPVEDETLTVNFQLGDHVALLMMRQAFNQMMIEKIDELTRKAKSDTETRAFWELMSPYRWNSVEHPINQVEFNIQVGGPKDQMSFVDTYWGKDDEARRYDNLDEIPDWIVEATREAIHAYIKILKGSLDYSEKIEACDVEGLVKLTGNTFENVKKWLNPRLMSLDANVGKGTQEWVPDYHARLRVDQVESKFWQVKEFIKISRQDTQHIVMAVGIITGLASAGTGGAGFIILGVSEVGLEAAVELPRYLESRSEIAFARGTVDILGYGRHMQAKVDEFSGYEYLGKIALAAAAELGVGPGMLFLAKVGAAPIELTLWASRKGLNFSIPVLQKSLLPFRKGIRYVLARRGEALLKRYDFDVSKVPSNLMQHEYKAMMEYIIEAVLRKAIYEIDDDQVKIFLRLEEVAAVAKTRPRWSRKLDDATHEQIKDLYFRKDIKQLIKSAGDSVNAAMRKGGRSLDETLSILRYSSVRTGKRFNDTLKARLDRTIEPKGPEFYDMASLTNKLVRKLLRRARWFINIVPKRGAEISDSINIRDPASNVDEMKRSFDPQTGTLSMTAAYRYEVAAHIDIGLPYNLSKKGVPSFLFAQLRYMQKMDIGYAGRDGEVLKKVVMDNITNARTIVQLAWYMKIHHPGKSVAELNESGALSEFLKRTRSLEYARSVINLAGYKVKSVRLGSDTPYVGKLIHAMENFKIGRDGEGWDQFLKRYGLSNRDRGPAMFDIEIEVVPHPNAFRKVASNDNVPRIKDGGGGGSKGGGGDADPVGRPPNDDPPSDVGTSTGAGDEPGYMQTLRRLLRESNERFERARDRYVKGVEEGTELMADAADEFEEIADYDMLLELLESAVADARRLGVPDDYIANRVADFEHFQTPSGRIRQVEQLNSRALRQEGFDIMVDVEDTGNLSVLLGRVRAGTTTPEDLRALRELIQRADDRGDDFIGDLGRTQVMMPGDTSEPLVNAFTLGKLRDLVRRENLQPRETVTSVVSAPDPDLPPSIANQVEQRLASLDQGEREARGLSSEMLVRMGVPDEHAMDFAVESTRSLMGSEGGSVISPLRQAIFLADGIMQHGSRRVDLKEFARVTGLPRRILEVGAQVAAVDRGLAILPEEIMPARFYPPM